MLRIIATIAALAVSPVVATAGDAKGEWLRDDGKAQVRFASCGGDALWRRRHMAQGSERPGQGRTAGVLRHEAERR